MAQGFVRPGALVSTQWLAERLGDPELRIYDPTVHLLPDPPRIYKVVSGRGDYDKGHIPGADFLDLQEELSEPHPRLKFMMASPERFAAAMSRHGLGPKHTAVIYSQTNPQWATRLWWMLRAMGFDRAHVLDGGLTKWKAEGRPLSTEPARYPPARFEARPRPGLFVGKDEVRRAIGDGAVCTLNALRRELHDGSAKVNYGRPGRIPGSVNVPSVELVDEQQAYLPPERLRAAFEGAGVSPGRKVLAYCGGGIAATSDVFVLHMLGYDDLAVYDASMTEWANDPSLPMEAG
jgi:thiosulfate/3-mercaptopyruvate sulfurtransferase